MARRAWLGCLVVLVALNAPVGHARSDQVVDGRSGPGSLYRLVRPANWNGSLVVYAHGFVSPDEPVSITPYAELVISLLAPQGFAVAVSSFSDNGWVIKDGTQRTHQLLSLFTSKFGRPTTVYVGGASMGGLIATRLVETYPGTYAGALVACGATGGTRRLSDYYAHTRALFDFFYPNVLPGSAADLPVGTDLTQDIALPAIAAMSANLLPALQLAAVDQAPLPFATPAELVESIVSALVGNAGFLAQNRTLTKGHPAFDNRTTAYSSAILPAPLLQAINAGVERFDASPSARLAFDHNYEPSGDLRLPMLMISNARDPVVPGFNQTSYAAAVDANGAANLLVRREVPTFGHCVFTSADLAAAFSDLVLWVQFGIKPTP